MKIYGQREHKNANKTFCVQKLNFKVNGKSSSFETNSMLTQLSEYILLSSFLCLDGVFLKTCEYINITASW